MTSARVTRRRTWSGRLALTALTLWTMSAVAAPATGARATENNVDANGIPQGEGALYATLHTTHGTLVIELFEKQSPVTVGHFVGLATGAKSWTHPKTGEVQKDRPLYDGTTFHRVIPNFMIQGGDPFSHAKDGEPAKVGFGEPGFRFANERDPSLKFDRPGVVAMANSGPDTNGCQFFITEVATPHLDGGYTIFGTVVKGFEIVPKIARTPKSAPVTIEKVVITRGKY